MRAVRAGRPAPSAARSNVAAASSIAGNLSTTDFAISAFMRIASITMLSLCVAIATFVALGAPADVAGTSMLIWT